ncbi:S8 family serine peptidase [uncultured Ezakiella sp.]|uniref:S8 family serine peptidase n=1 Tax=uncultured Ezakiella sp. TaxID=1637529 RepID=UPI0025D54A6A|nr:S8 family serine peptidase [uncultured Ezakiella sp.]
MNKNKILSVVLSLLFLLTSIPDINAKGEPIDKVSLLQDMLNEAPKEVLEIHDEKMTDGESADEEIEIMITIKAPCYLDLANEDYMDENIKNRVLDSQKGIIKNIKSINEAAKIKNRYYYATNGLSVITKRKYVKKIALIDGVKEAKEAVIYTKQMSGISSELGMAEIYRDLGLKGEKIIVAVLDSGIDASHKDMRVSPGSEKFSKNEIEKLKKENKISYGLYSSDKVPFAYNYADGNNKVKEAFSTSPGYSHGMHVAGIIGANCASEEEIKNKKGIRGIAPEVQLYNMKIFSNDPNKGASEGDIVQAIEDAIKLKADVINMSLGMSAGFTNPSDLQQEAIKKAREQNVIVVTAGGNAAFSTYPNEDNRSIDNGTVATPGLSLDSIQVASFDNKKKTVDVFNTTVEGQDKKIQFFKSDSDPILMNNYEGIVDCNLGRQQDIENLDLKNKIAIIKRGEIEFKDKKLNVKNKGAIGAIIYNKDGDDELLQNISTDPKVSIPTIFVSNSSGKYIVENIEKIKIKFSDSLEDMEFSDDNYLSNFSSWGPTPDLEMKPDLASIGGSVFSTVNDNKYKNMSGTSMAAPVVSGLTALMIEKYKGMGLDNYQNYIKTALMNTADIKYQNGNYVDVRKQGAGFVNIKKALAADVFFTCNGLPNITLKEINSNKDLTVKVKSISDKKKDFKISFIGNGLSYNGPDSININPKAENEMNVSFSPTGEKNRFVDGYLIFEDDQEKYSLPVLGFYGDFSNLPMFDNKQNNNPIFKETGLYSSISEGYFKKLMPLEGIIDESLYAMNPQDANAYNNVLVKFTLLRNAKYLKINIEDVDGNEIKIIDERENLSKDVKIDQEVMAKVNFYWQWSGGIYDKKLGVKKPIDEGQYYINVYAKPDFTGANMQKLSFPIKIDKTPPKVEVADLFFIDSPEFGLNIKAKDEGIVDSKINTFLFLLNGKKYEEDGEFIFKISNENDYYKKKFVLNQSFNTIDIGVTDHARNMAYAQTRIIVRDLSKIKVEPKKITYDNKTPFTIKYDIDNSNVINYEICLDSWDNVIKNTDKKEFIFDKMVQNQSHKIIIKALDKDGNIVDATFIDMDVDDNTSSGSEDSINLDYLTNKYSFKNGDLFEGKIKVRNEQSKEEKITLIVSLYDQQNKFINSAVAEKVLKSNEESILSAKIKVPMEGDYKIKILVWKGLDEMETMILPVIVNQR